MTLENWLTLATRRLSTSAAAQVRTEIREHYDTALAVALAGGATHAEARRLVLNNLGDPRIANCDYRRVLLTSQEARVLREGAREADTVCSRPWIKPVAFALYLLILAASAGFALTGRVPYAIDALCAAFGLSPFLAMIFVPINTPARGFLFRCARWIAMSTAPLLILGPDAWRYSWLLLSCLAPLAVTEITRASLRRKLPIKAWPRHLYL